MRALFEAGLEHLGAKDVVVVECVCGHVDHLTAANFAAAGIEPYQVILDLQHRMRCRECDARGKTLIAITWKGQ